MISLSFPVHDFRWRHFRWRHIRWCNFRSRLRTRSLPAPPHCTTSNARWMVLLYYSPYHRTNFESGDKHHNLGMDKVTHYTYCDFPGYSKCGKNILWHFSCDFFSYLSCDFLSWDFFSVYHLCIVYMISHLLEVMYENKISTLLKFHVLPWKELWKPPKIQNWKETQTYQIMNKTTFIK
jgi:hypothetical protein